MLKHLGVLGLLITMAACTYTVAAHVVPTLADRGRMGAAELSAKVRAATLAAETVAGYRAALQGDGDADGSAESTIAIAAFGYREPPPRRKSRPVLEPLPEVALGLVYEADGDRFALVDRKLYAEGEVLPTGERIARVATDRIVLEGTRGQREVSLDTTKSYTMAHSSSLNRSTTPPVQFRIPVSGEEGTDRDPEPRIAGGESFDSLVSRETP